MTEYKDYYEKYKNFWIKTPGHRFQNKNFIGVGYEAQYTNQFIYNINNCLKLNQARLIANYLVSKGFNHSSAIAVTANIIYFSSGSPGFVGHKFSDEDKIYIPTYCWASNVEPYVFNNYCLNHNPHSESMRTIRSVSAFPIFNSYNYDFKDELTGEILYSATYCYTDDYSQPYNDRHDDFLNGPNFNQDDLLNDWMSSDEINDFAYGFFQHCPAKTYVNNLKNYRPSDQWRNNGELQLDYFNDFGSNYWKNYNSLLDPAFVSKYDESFDNFKKGVVNNYTDEEFCNDFNLTSQGLITIKSNLKWNTPAQKEKDFLHPNYIENSYPDGYLNKWLSALTLGFRARYDTGLNNYRFYNRTGSYVQTRTFQDRYMPYEVQAELIYYAMYLKRQIFPNIPDDPSQPPYVRKPSTTNYAMNAATGNNKKRYIFMK